MSGPSTIGSGISPLRRFLQLAEVHQHPRLSGILLGLITWIAIALVFPKNLMPLPHEAGLIVVELVVQGNLWAHLWGTLWRTLWGFLGACLIGGSLGVLIGSNRYTRHFFVPYIVIGLSIPAVAWAAITTVAFGLGDVSPVVSTVAVVFPYVGINVWKGVENIDADLISMSRSFEISNRRLLLRTILPSAAPHLFTAFRLGLAMSWKIVTIAEMFASSNGIGNRIITSYERFKFEEAWAWGLVFMILILLIEYGLFKPLERRVFTYRQEVDFDVIRR